MKGLPSLKLRVRTKKWMVGILVSFWKDLFSGGMLVSGSVVLEVMLGHGTKKLSMKQLGPFLKSTRMGLNPQVSGISEWEGGGLFIFFEWAKVSSPFRAI